MGHMFRQRMERLVKYCIFQDLDFIDFDTCVDCIKRKLTTKVRKNKTDRCTDVLDLICTDICRPSIPPTMGGYIYFINFVDDFSRHSHIELIHEKSDSLEPFKAFKAKVELHKGKKIMAVNSDRYDEYYDRYDETECNPRLLARFLQDCGIDARYIMSGTHE